MIKKRSKKRDRRPLARLGEGGLLRQIILPMLSSNNRRRYLIAPGDDAAVLKNPRRNLFSIDSLTEGTHFKMAWDSTVRKLCGFSLAWGVGYKLAASALSDLGAMGGSRHRWMMVSMVAPRNLTGGFVSDVLQGLLACAKKNACLVVGGDTVRGQKLTLTAAVGGELIGRAVSRGGAEPGDLVGVVGALGAAREGLNFFETGGKGARVPRSQRIARKFFMPEPLLSIGHVLAKEPGVHSLIDVSDPLSQCARHVADASGVGMKIDLDRVPVVLARFRNFRERWRCVNGGEDYALLLTFRHDRLAALKKKIHLAVIGEVLAPGRSVAFYFQGRRVKERSSFQHF